MQHLRTRSCGASWRQRKLPQGRRGRARVLLASAPAFPRCPCLCFGKLQGTLGCSELGAKLFGGVFFFGGGAVWLLSILALSYVVCASPPRWCPALRWGCLHPNGSLGLSQARLIPALSFSAQEGVGKFLPEGRESPRLAQRLLPPSPPEASLVALG